MKVVEIRSEEELQALRPAWNALLESSGSNTIFLTWEWVSAWWSSYGTPGELRILAAYDDAGELRGIAPLRLRRLERYGLSAPAQAFIGDGSNDSDYLDLMVQSGYEAPVMDAFRSRWREELNRGAVLLFQEIPETSPHLPAVTQFAEAQELICKTSEVPCGTTLLPGSWDDYLKLLRPRFRTKVRSVLRNLESRPEVRFGFCESRDDIERMLPILFDLHARRWAQDGKPGVFGWRQKREFYHALSALLLERGWLRFSWMSWKDQVLACQYGFCYNETYFHLQEGYEPEAEHWNAGIGLRAWTIREFVKDGLREYDFLGGVGRHKTDWGAEVKRSKQLLIAAATPKNRVICHGPDWEERLKESAKRVIPEAVLAARRKRLERQAAVTPPSGSHPAEANGSLRTLAAQCYYHLGLPALLRPARDRYQFNLPSNGGGGSRFSWTRRTQAVGRILCYHRINDENDPFFPAISTRVFEDQMRFLSRHYKVVSLEEMLTRLEGGPAEPVVAITFDDGYLDNYEIAFPILQRYGVPATIFLTTGSIDAPEPLWFEQLALAVKKTTLEFLDLEIDRPRRFWLRTEAERLDANGRIFTILKDLDDSGRRGQLAEVLRMLGYAGPGERADKMLAWDQVRFMKQRGVDFGGHTVTHPFLAKTTTAQAAWEAAECKQRIEQELQEAVHYFAYPNGREHDFGGWNKDVIRSAGYRAAVTTIWGVNHASTDRMALRRGGPWEQLTALFAYKLDWYQFANQ